MFPNTLKRKNMTHLRHFAILFVIALTSTLSVAAQTTTFAQFVQQDAQQDFVLTNNTSSSDFTSVSGGTPVYFFYSNIAGLDPSLIGPQFGRMYVTSTTSQPGVLNLGSVTQPMNQSILVQVIRDTPAPVGSGSRTNLLTAIISPAGQTPGIVGTSGGNSANLSATTPEHVVTFSSDFLLFGLTIQRNLSFSFSSVAPSLSLGSGSFLQNFAAAGSGTFASNPPPTPFVFSSAGVSVGGRVASKGGFGIGNATVTITDEGGTVRTATTNNFGFFRIEDIPAGQSVVVEVRSRRHAFSPRVLNIEEAISDLEIVPDI